MSTHTTQQSTAQPTDPFDYADDELLLLPLLLCTHHVKSCPPMYDDNLCFCALQHHAAAGHLEQTSRT